MFNDIQHTAPPLASRRTNYIAIPTCNTNTIIDSPMLLPIKRQVTALNFKINVKHEIVIWLGLNWRDCT